MSPTTRPDRELKRISLELRALASAALRASNEDAQRMLRRLLLFVDVTPLLAAEVAGGKSTPEAAGAMWKAACEQGGTIDLPDDAREEVQFLDALLRHLSTTACNGFWQLVYGYAGHRGGKFADHVEEALHLLVGPYANYLNRIVELALLDSVDLAYEARGIAISFQGDQNQVSVAQDGATTSHVMGVTEVDPQVVALARDLVEATIAQANGEGHSGGTGELREAASSIAQDLATVPPRRARLKGLVETLENYAKGAGAISSLASHAIQLAEKVRPWL